MFLTLLLKLFAHYLISNNYTEAKSCLANSLFVTCYKLCKKLQYIYTFYTITASELLQLFEDINYIYIIQLLIKKKGYVRTTWSEFRIMSTHLILLWTFEGMSLVSVMVEVESNGFLTRVSILFLSHMFYAFLTLLLTNH